MGKLRDLKGQIFYELVVLSMVDSNRGGKMRWLCKCSCGNEKVYSMDHLTRKTNPIKSCGCKKIKRGIEHSQWGGYGEISGNWWHNHVGRERKQNTRVKIPLTIDVKYIWELFLEQNKKCSLSGILLTISNNYVYNTASLDRIDSSKGYEDGNVQWVHKHVNFMKRTYSQDYFIDMCKKIAENHK